MIYFVRHGLSEANVKKLFAGQKEDSPLVDEGQKQARVTAQKIKTEGIVIDKIISSPLKRAFETAEIIAEELGFDVSSIIIEPRISEYDMGNLTGTPWHEISSSILVSAKGAEDPKMFCARVCDCIKELSESPENILVVSHAGVGRMLETVKEDIELRLFYDLPAYNNASITIINWLK